MKYELKIEFKEKDELEKMIQKSYFEDGSKGKLIGFSIKETWETIEINLAKGDRIILYTDGIVEVKNFSGEQLGEEKFIEYIETYKYLNAKDLIEATKRMILDYCFQVNQEDDLTLIVIDILE